MSWKAELEELSLRKQLALKMGGEDKVARQHAEGKLTAEIDFSAPPRPSAADSLISL